MADLLPPISIVRPPVIEIGAGSLAKVGSFAAARGGTTLVVADAFNAGRVDRLGLAGPVVVFGTVKPEPDIPNLEQLVALADRVRPSVVIGFGGGSAMDLAKLAVVLTGSGLDVRGIAGVGKAPERSAALVQVPTTAGTGSEAGIRALVTDPATRNKVAVESRSMLADLAVLDPELTFSVPPAVTAATGVDALAHCVEAFTSRRAHPLIDVYALEGIRLVGRFLKRAVTDGDDVAARTGLAVASLYGGFCLGPVNTTAGHAVSYPLGTRHGIPHGLANALIFPHVLAFNAPAVPEKTALVLEALGVPDGKSVFDGAYRFCERLGIDMRLSAAGVPADDLDAMAAEAHAIRRLLDFNPRDIGKDEIRALYQAAY
ncbi:iron-containing alcohol dehydrogenase [Prosthecomicrobium pneumaticum]|uniref:Alcohol dehydrogenase class IV n=1 Tax=Prosthecomicrobium pneumaticum TaxID=81895 RepID=A0A7W9FPR4_9HYPH|nr:iron-containing alcohol dehydrogenase [Prosthecomicrobium pneumaticum]MBB5754530.1 alcohol dehydrogenase class IV [Prosthecomicrobium pneumaticum]